MKILIDDFEIDIHGAQPTGLTELLTSPGFGDLLNTVSNIVKQIIQQPVIFPVPVMTQEPPAAAPPPPKPRARKKPAKRVTKKR